jgi:hypothetical protein
MPGGAPPKLCLGGKEPLAELSPFRLPNTYPECNQGEGPAFAFAFAFAFLSVIPFRESAFTILPHPTLRPPLLLLLLLFCLSFPSGICFYHPASPHAPPPAVTTPANSLTR